MSPDPSLEDRTRDKRISELENLTIEIANDLTYNLFEYSRPSADSTGNNYIYRSTTDITKRYPIIKLAFFKYFSNPVLSLFEGKQTKPIYALVSVKLDGQTLINLRFNDNDKFRLELTTLYPSLPIYSKYQNTFTKLVGQRFDPTDPNIELYLSNKPLTVEFSTSKFMPDAIKLLKDYINEVRKPYTSDN